MCWKEAHAGKMLKTREHEKFPTGLSIFWGKISSLNKASSMKTMVLSSEYLYVFYFFSLITSEHYSNER